MKTKAKSKTMYQKKSKKDQNNAPERPSGTNINITLTSTTMLTTKTHSACSYGPPFINDFTADF